MCGIVGYVSSRSSIPVDRIQAMCNALVHRGPDGSGLVAWDETLCACDGHSDARIGLGHRRLSIIDLSEAGAQPMSNEDGSLWITYNGEFYNFQDFRSELECQGHVFRSHCDTETILHLYEEVGLEKALANMNGMFAFGLWNSKKQELILARDRLGKKPLYYAHLPDGSLLFASEIKALLASGKIDRTRLDFTALDQFWTFGFPIGSRTIFEQIRRLEAAQYLVWKHGKTELHTYWDCPFGVQGAPDRKLDDWADELEELLCDAIRIRLVSDVPLGIFLSGGIDSSLLAALAVRKLNRNVGSYTISFEENEFDESFHATRIAQHLGISNTILKVDGDMRSYFSSIAHQFDGPFGDSSAIPTYFVAKSARQHVTVTLTGDGGDELFGGYDTFKEGLGLWGTHVQQKKFRRKLTLPEACWHAKLRWIGNRRGFDLLQSQTSPKHRRRLYSEQLRQAISPSLSLADRAKWYRPVQGADWLSQMQYVSMKVNMVDDVLEKVDRMSMANSLECRSPLLDYRVVEFASRLPFSAKIDEWGKGKAILRLILSRYIPLELFDRPKQGFCAPWEIWCQGDFGKLLRARWSTMGSRLFSAKAAEWLFPVSERGSAFRQWQAFSLLEFLKSTRE